MQEDVPAHIPKENEDDISRLDRQMGRQKTWHLMPHYGRQLHSKTGELNSENM